jgi:CBS domain-containing protein
MLQGGALVQREDQSRLGRVADLMPELKRRTIPVVHQEGTVSEIVEAFVDSDHSRLVYVVDEQGRLEGCISLGNLIRHVFFHYHDHYVDTRSLTSKATSETARHLMQREPVFTVESEELEDVLQRMIRHNLKEIPILDDKKRVVADLTVVDLLNHYRSVKGNDLS